MTYFKLKGKLPMNEQNQFVSDGYDRARDANEPAIRAQVEAELAYQMKTATWIERRKLRKQIEAEINRRCDELAPPDANY